MQSALEGIPGIQKVEIHLEEKEAVVQYATQRVEVAELIDAVKKVGFNASLKTAD